jgi:hypothetical protein
VATTLLVAGPPLLGLLSKLSISGRTSLKLEIEIVAENFEC